MKTFAILTAAATIAAGSTFAMAQGAKPEAGRDGPGMRAERLTKDDFASLVDARVAAVKAGMKFTPEQEKLWQPVESIMRKTADERAERWENMREQRSERREERREARQSGEKPEPIARPDFAERLDRMAERAETRAERAKELAGAVKPLWASLDERQQRLLPVLMRPANGGMNRHSMGHRGHHGGWQR